MEEVRDEVPLEFPKTLPPRSLLIFFFLSHVAELSDCRGVSPAANHRHDPSLTWRKVPLLGTALHSVPCPTLKVKVSIFWALQRDVRTWP